MTLLDDATRRTDNADLVILALVENIRGRNHQANSLAVAAQIRGAPPREIGLRLNKLCHLGLVEEVAAGQGYYRLTLMGEELLRREVGGWTPDLREAARRESAAYRRAD